jgi:hypothetical protein
MHLLLVTTAACGGAVASTGNSGGGGGGGSGQGDPAGDPGDPEGPHSHPNEPVEASVPDASVFDVAVFDVLPDVTVQCVNGNLDPDPKWCCASGDPVVCGSGGGGGGGGDQCMLDCKSICAAVAPGQSGGFTDCFWTTDPAGASKINYLCGACGVGRIPEGTLDRERGATIGERLAMQAYYEAASVFAFSRLADVLVREKAPRALVRRVKRAARDERRHAALFSRLAEARGATTCAPSIDDHEPSLLELAIENAREGCVRETYGALVALHQSRHAVDAELRAAFAAIADDEIAHAALSWDLARFFEKRLGHAVRFDAAELRAAATRDHDAIDRALGMPEPETARALFDGLFEQIAA